MPRLTIEIDEVSKDVPDAPDRVVSAFAYRTRMDFLPTDNRSGDTVQTHLPAIGAMMIEYLLKLLNGYFGQPAQISKMQIGGPEKPDDRGADVEKVAADYVAGDDVKFPEELP